MPNSPSSSRPGSRSDTSRPINPTHETKKKKKKAKNQAHTEKIDPLEGKYTGDLWEGLRQGSGTLVFLNGDTYEGEFSRGTRHGKGVAKYRNGQHEWRVYDGDWKRSLRDGEGKETWPNGEIYFGEWHADKFHGNGTLKRGSSTYAGGFKEGRKHGYGVCVFSSGNFYEGEWENGRMEGWGEYHLVDDSRYEGEWKDGLKQGLGVFTSTSGEKFDGHWLKGKRHGEGIYRWNNGKTRQGIWNHDSLLKWTNKETFGTMINYHRGRPPRLNRKGNLDIIKNVREEALYLSAQHGGHGKNTDEGIGSGATAVQSRLKT